VILSRRQREALVPWAFVAPALVVFGTFAVLPMVAALFLGLFTWRGGEGAVFAGLANYAEAFGDAVFWRAILRNIELAVVSVTIQIPVALALAVLLAGRVKGRAIFRTALFAPVVLPTVVIAFFWRLFLLDPVDGLAGAMFESIGLEGPAWLHEPSLAFASVVSAISWRHIGFHMVILLAGALAVPEELYDAARVDGAGAWARFRHVTLPGMRGAISVSVLLSVIGSLRYFDLIYIMTGGGPDHATELGATWIYSTGIAGQRWGYGSALAVMLLVVSGAVAWGVLILRRRMGGVTDGVSDGRRA
jgi:raffinose/stachyose/melibiose transport system permease protein